MEKLYRSLKLVLLVLIFVALILGAMILYQRLTEDYMPGAVANTGSITDNPAPDFTVLDDQGKEVSLSGFQGKPVIVNFWASWCGPCKSEMPAFEQAYQTYGHGIQFMMVNLTDGVRETATGAAEFIEEKGYTFPVYFDTGYSGAIAYNVTAIPATYFIDADGNLIAKAQGALNEERLQEYIDQLLAA